MPKLHTIKKQLQQRSSNIKEQFQAEIIGIFGSVATGEERRESDIDLLVTFEDSSTLFDYIDLCDYLEKELGQPVDVVTERGIREDMENVIYNQLERL